VWDGQPSLDGMSAPDRVRLVLLDDHTLGNREVAVLANATAAQVERVRRSMIDVGLLMPRRVVAAHLRGFKELPRSPRILAEGLCVGHAQPDYWTSDDWHERQVAISVCQSCHVLDACREWSLSLPAKDQAIYAGLTSLGRARLRRQRAGLPEPANLVNANARRAARRAAQRKGAA
jgi:transcription factor WhiB